MRAVAPVAALTSEGLTAAALTSISTWLSLRASGRRSITGASDAAVSALAGNRTQRASTKADPASFFILAGI
jgi:hypothetical protein